MPRQIYNSYITKSSTLGFNIHHNKIKLRKRRKGKSNDFTVMYVLHVRLNGLTLQQVPSGAAICCNLNCDWKAKKRGVATDILRKHRKNKIRRQIYGAKMWVRESIACREGISTLQRPSQGQLPLTECAN